MKVGITLNDTLRSFDSVVAEVHEKFIQTNKKVAQQTIKDMSDTPIDAGTDTDKFVLNKVSNEEEELPLLKLSVDDDPLLVTHRYEFKDKEQFESFLYDDYAFEVFSRTTLVYPEAMDDFNKLYNELVNLKNSVTVVSQERNVSKQATLLFLAQNKFQGNNIKFLYNYSKVWELYDLIITSNPLVIVSKPENKTCIKVNTPINGEFEADYSFDDLYGVLSWVRKLKTKTKN